jgi:hypothetical protein
MQLGPVVTLPDGPHRVAAVDDLAGGTSKGVRRVRFVDGGSVVVYTWAPGEDRWQGTSDAGDEEPFIPVPGPGPLLTATALLERARVRVPRVLLHDADSAVVEDVTGPRLVDVLATVPEPVLAGLAGILGRLRSVESDRCGRPGAPLDGPFAAAVHARALQHLAFAAARVPAIGGLAGPLRRTLGHLLGAVRERPGYSLVHGELGPEHVIVANGEPVLIDVEGLMFADPEWEHAYLRMRLDDRYAALDPGDLDPARLELYSLALHLSLVAGPLRLAGEPGELGAFMRGIAAHHTGQVLAVVAGPAPWSGPATAGRFGTDDLRTGGRPTP